MANNFSGLYTGGATVFNQLPYAQLALNMQRYKDAKQEAIDNYYRDLSKTLTPSGMAGNDVDDFTNKVNTWRDYVTQNRDVLNNPKDKNYSQAVQQEGYLYNDALQLADKSRQKVKDLYQARELIKPDHPMTHTSLDIINAGGLPISKGYIPIDFSGIQYDPKENQFTGEDLIKYRNSLRENFKMDKNISKPVDLGMKTKAIETTSSYSPQTISAMADFAHNLYNSDNGFKGYVDGIFNNPSALNQANQRFKEIYGNQYDIQNPEEIAAAMLMPQLEEKSTQPYSYNPTTVNVNTDKSAATAGDIDDYINNIKQNSNQPLTITYPDGTKKVGKLLQPSPELSEIFASKTQQGTVYPSQISLLPNGNYLPVFHKLELSPDGKTYQIKYNKDGSVSMDADKSQEVDAGEVRRRIAQKIFGIAGAKAALKYPSKQQNTTNEFEQYKRK
jgi:hypothetical protein